MSVAEALAVPPLDRGSVIAGHRGLGRAILWADIMHAPAQTFVRSGDLVLTTGADVHQESVRDFLTYLLSSPAAGVVISPPRDVGINELLASLIPLADRKRFPVVFLPWEVPFSEVMRALLPRLAPPRPDLHVQTAIGRRERDCAEWHERADRFAEVLARIADTAGLAVESSVTDGLIMSRFVSGPSAAAVSDVVAAAQNESGIPTDLVSWAVFPPQGDEAAGATLNAPARLSSGPLGARQFAEVLRQHPRSMAAITQTLQPLIEYDKTRSGQLVHTLEVLLQEGANTSAAARALFLNRHSLLYRIKLIEELTGLSIKNSTDRFHLEASIRVHQINASRAMDSGSK
ncbi:MAG: PucR family transcriptional regulator ligand-binding domain-containing protein [Mycobacterium sp.]